jgi:hypothetical protein
LFISLLYTILLGALLSILLYVAASARKFRLRHLVHLEDGGWEMRDAPKELLLVESALDLSNVN